MHINGSPAGSGPGQFVHPDPEVPASPKKAKRRQFTTRFKLRVLEETDRLADGEIGAYLRKNGLYWSYLSDWRRLRETGALSGSAAKPRGRKKAAPDQAAREVAALRKELDKTQERLRKANLILEVQKKVLLLCEDKLQSNSSASC